MTLTESQIAELNVALAHTSSVAQTGYSPLRSLFTSWGMAPMTGTQAHALAMELTGAVVLDQMDVDFEAARKASAQANKAQASKLAVGQTVEYVNPKGETHNGVVSKIAGKTIYVVRSTDNKMDVARKVNF